jgi:hypothetical protein
MRYVLTILTSTLCLSFSNVSIAQTAAVDNKLSQSITFRAIPRGASVYGIFEGRPPCQLIAKQVDSFASAECNKVKWQLTLYYDSITKQPTTYQHFRRYLPAEGKWKIIKGMLSNPDATIYQLELAKPGTYFYFLKGDDNVLFVLDENKTFRVGNEDFSYTLNRVELVAGKK